MFMSELHPEKLHVTFHQGTNSLELSLPRRFTLTHSDTSGDLFLSIGSEYDQKQISGFYTRFMRDEVLAELKQDGRILSLHVYCHVSGGLVFGSARWRFEIFHHHMRMVLEAFRYGDRELIASHPDLDQSLIKVHYSSNHKRYDRVEDWGAFQEYKT